MNKANFDFYSDFDFKGRRISVIGAARSGMDAAEVLRRLGALVLLSDSQSAAQIGPQRLTHLHTLDVNFILGATVEMALPSGTQLVVTSPGVPRTAPVLQAAVAQGIPVWSEIELAYRLTKAPLIAITGTNGKTTTTLLIAHILRHAGRNAIVAGNISADEIKRTLINAAWETRQEADYSCESPPIIVAEISSFQLEWVDKFAPHIAILTNVTPDHLNRYDDFEDYAQTKARLFAAQTSEDWAIVNYGNPTSQRIGKALQQEVAPQRDTPQRVWFTSSQAGFETEMQSDAQSDAASGIVSDFNALPVRQGGVGWIEEGIVNIHLASGCAAAIMRTSDLPPTLPGTHSIENVLAASIAALALNITPDIISAAIHSFPGVPHRLEWVHDLNGARYINNSMCTNVEAAISSLQAMDRPTIAIMGGADKQLDYAPLVPALHAKVRHAILIGQVADKMEAVFRSGGYVHISRAHSLEDAVAQARQIAKENETVLLVPACASFDMFRDFEARGVAFREAVHALATP